MFWIFTLNTISAQVHAGDSLVAIHTNTLPIINGDPSDAVWNDASWNAINYSWIPYAEVIPAADFSGRFKVMWNKSTNLLYFLVEITDDLFVNGYVYSKTNGNYPLYDCLEVFLDEDRPGGDHGCNNSAFAYHITGGNSTTDYDAMDIFDPTNSYNWGAGIYVNSRSHLPEFKRTNVGTKYYWEFSLMVLKNTFKPTDIPTSFLASLIDGKKMGLTVAYCDNDHSSSNLVRDHFVASKYETQANKDISWQNSTTFGHLTLKENGANAVGTANSNSAHLWVDANKQLICELGPNWSSPVLTLFDMYGRMVLEEKVSKDTKINLSRTKSGCYLVRIKEYNQSITTKVIF